MNSKLSPMLQRLTIGTCLFCCNLIAVATAGMLYA